MAEVETCRVRHRREVTRGGGASNRTMAGDTKDPRLAKILDGDKVLSRFDPKFTIDEKVRIIGLEARPELNGVLGTVIGPLQNGRYPVKLDGGNTKGGGLKIKPNNLRKGTCAAAGGPVPLPIDDDERQRIPLPRNVKKLCEFVRDNSASDGARLECFKSLQGHAENESEDHHADLRRLGVPETAVGVLADASSSAIVRGAAVGLVQNLAMVDDNAPFLVEAGMVKALAKLLKQPNAAPPVDVSDVSNAPSTPAAAAAAEASAPAAASEAAAAKASAPAAADDAKAAARRRHMESVARRRIRESAADALLNLSYSPDAKQAVSRCPAALTALANLAKEADDSAGATPAAQASAMAVLLDVVMSAPSAVAKAGAGGAAVCMLRRDSTTRAGLERAVGVLHILSLSGAKSNDASSSDGAGAHLMAQLEEEGVVNCLRELYMRPDRWAKLTDPAQTSVTECLALWTHLAAVKSGKAHAAGDEDA